MRVVLAGGGTAGHIEPALATADALRRVEPEAEITLLGTERGLENRLVPERGYDLALIPPVPLPRRVTPELLRLPARVRGAVRRTADVLRERRADVLVGFGGYVALPAYLAARRLGLATVVHEANARPGLANRLGARFTSYVAATSSTVGLRNSQEIGIPLRRAITSLDRASTRAEGRTFFGLPQDAPTLLVFGGSQGARRLNLAVDEAGEALTAAGVQILHAVGSANIDAVTPRPGYTPVAYIDRMDLAYAAADLVLCRAGALTCAELAAVGLPAVYVPLPHGNGEQRLNAEPTVEAGGGLMIRDTELNGSWLVQHALPLLTDPDRLAEMSTAAARLGHRDADERLVEMVRQAASEGGGGHGE
ncbi:undecaprenyldiphospho-muramoylpentapeptide beta-N-acetylglucosaminyltransferase [Actinobacteria bacterium YIM 96077]|uniref:UDP-N-acetylglucosamine--N-acetylmuramyl-(pentapeptide) pyrophosphoryl-undecaprenol N-acetylglucosamine transferase n=1 Tax=Phytoactinopolyspora halophila TaxID=1981511 RepID=A0A329QW69_9ACTN|nr:undecaprenyldiphospho-muramoylpentapeptide beta-N-acetylglucosaminyltransferase [Phytoactinopolyspora halophila]AYY12844.1 undecaprenyldiphospho-muramoylpentapeptide beta-N-acetylglucosaminyltransferase [Actinobacteria bacterium YIM 96077]RAW16363.1 undecaprenyldiphospho-muramoylpentapeptide beta-N-acetylglucosaminyltransferase [Phytoactinopolyspora halophila]